MNKFLTFFQKWNIEEIFKTIFIVGAVIIIALFFIQVIRTVIF